MEKVTKTGNESQTSLDALQKRMDLLHAELEEKMKKVEDDSVAGKEKFEKELEETKDSFKYVMSEIKEICEFLALREEEVPQEDHSKRKKKEKKSKL